MRPKRFQFGGPDHFDRSCEEAEPCSGGVKRIAVGFFVFEGVFETEDLEVFDSMTMSLDCCEPQPT